MSLPGNVLSSTPIKSALISPDDSERKNLREDFERGGVAVNDPTQGLDVKTWRGWTDGASIFVAPLPGLTPVTTVTTGVGITEVALAFDQNMEVTVAYVEGGATKLRWYDTQASATVTTTWTGARSPMLTLDDKRATAGAANDVIFAYIRDGQARYRQQRDRYSVEYTLGPVPSDSARIEQLGMGVNNRLQFKVTAPPSAVRVDLLTDTMFVVGGTDLMPVAGGAVRAAVWRSRTYQVPEQPSPGWGRVEGSYPMQVRLIGDGEVRYTTPPILDAEPFRFPALRCREWALEVVGTNRVVEVCVSGDRLNF
jgi:hypothetical protein